MTILFIWNIFKKVKIDADYIFMEKWFVFLRNAMFSIKTPLL
jgi:hypothetical protein